MKRNQQFHSKEMMTGVCPSGINGFTLVELLIVVLILGILSAVVIPQFSSAGQDAKEAALTTDLVILQKAIDLYHAQHMDIYPGTVSSVSSWANFVTHMSKTTDKFGDAGSDFGPYLRTGIPRNPINGLNTGKVGPIPGTADDSTGWYYDPETGEIRANCSGTTSEGTPIVELKGGSALIGASK